MHKNSKIKIFTIGFSKKTASQFFSILKQAQVIKLIDIRLNNNSQFCGFTKSRDLPFFLRLILNADYEIIEDFMPPANLLSAYRNQEITFQKYKKEYKKTLKKRDILDRYDLNQFTNCCFLCSEAESKNCHRRLLVDFFKEHHSDIKIIHL